MRKRTLLCLVAAVLAAAFIFRPQPAEKMSVAGLKRAGIKTAQPGEWVPEATQAAERPKMASQAVSGDVLTDFGTWMKRYFDASETERAALVVEGMKLARERRPVFKALIMENPQEAIQKAVPMVVRQKLPPEIVSLLEKRMNEIGAIRVMQGVPLDPNDPPVATYREVELQKGGTYRAYVYGERGLKLTWTAGASVNGVAMDSEFAISDEPTRRLEVGEILPAGKTVVANCPVSGKYVLDPEDVPEVVPESLPAVETPVEIITFCDGSHIAIQNQTILYGEGVTGGSFAFSGILPSSPTPALGQVKVIVLNTTYADQNALPSTEAQLYATLRDVADHYSKASYGRLSLTGVVAPPIKLPHNEAWYVNRDTSNGGDIGGTSISMADARAEARKMGFDWNDYDCTVMRHNGGPGSYGGLGGGSTVWCRSDSVSLWAHEIGHAFGLGHSNFWDTAGTSSIGNGANQEYGDSYDIMGGAGTTGHYNAQAKTQIRWLPASFIQPVTQSGLYRIHAFDQGALDSSKRYAMTILKDSQRTYWGMVRSLFDSNPFVKNGLVFGWRFPNGGGNNFQLIDTTNGSPYAKTDAPISLGATFGDTESGIYLTTVAVSDVPRYVDVQVNLGTFPGNNPPTMTLAANAEVIPLNGTVTFTATASDVDGDPLAFNWQHFGGGTQIVSPNSSVITRQFTTAGTFIVTCTVSDMKGGTVTRNQLITVGAVTTSTISGRVTLLGQGLPDVVITANNANGVITDADGYFTIPNLAANTYTLTPLLYGYTFGELFNNSISVGPSFTGADFEATAQSVVTITAANPSANELAPVTAGTFRLTRTGDISQDLVVNVNTALGGAVKGTDYNFAPDYVAGSQGFSSFTIPADSATLDIAVTPLVDASSEGPETVILQLGPGNGYLVGSASMATVIIADDDTALPKISLTATRNSVMENIATPGLLTISRSGSTAADLTVNLAVSGTATNGGDFTALSGTVTILAGNASATVEVAPVDDSTSETLETVIVTLSTNAAYIIDPLATAVTTTIYDDDMQTVSVTATDTEATEIDLSLPGVAADTGTFLITRSGDTSNALTVYYAFSGVTGSGVMALHGVDYEWMPGVVQIPAGQSSAAITIVPRFDGVGEGQERCVLNLGASATNYILGTSATATVNINDNAADTPYIDVVNTANGVEPSTNANFRFSLRGDATTDTPVAVNFTLGGIAQNGTDYDTIGWWLPQSSGSTENLRAIWAADAANLWAVGDNGTILKGDGTSWTAQASGTTQHLRAVWGTSATNLWAVGDGGVILKGDGTSWAAQTSGTTNALRGIWGSSGTNVFAVGDGGTIVRSTNGTSWAASTSGTTNQLRAVHGSGVSNVWAVGAAGTIRFWNGSTWGSQTSGISTQLNAVFAVNSTNIWAVGAGGVVRKGSGTTWASQTSASTADLNSVWASSTTNLLVSGSSSAQLVSTNGTSWTNMMLSALGTFNGVFGTSSTIGWAVGDGGTIFKRDNATAINVPGSVVIPRGASTLDLALRTFNDADLEDLESIALSITPGAAYQIFPPSSSASAWLRDNDNVNTLVVDTQVGTGGAISIAEGASTSPVKFYISRLGSTAAEVTVNITYGGTATMTDDYTAPASVTIPAGATGVNVPVTIVNDTTFEGTETITFNFAAGGYGRGQGAVMYITDNDTATATVAFSAPSSSGLENAGTVNIPVTLSAAQATDVTVEYLTSGSTSSTSASFGSRAVPYWVRVVKTGNSLAFFQANDGVTWTQRGNAVTVSNLGSSYLAGLAFAPGSTTQFTAVMDNFTVSDLSAGGSTGAETAVSIGAVTGGSSVASGVYTFTNSGNGLSNSTTDSFRYVYLPVTSSANCTITARIVSNGNPAVVSRSGVMLRSSTAANSVHASAFGTGATTGEYYSIYRTTTAGSATLSSSFTSLILPMWVRTSRVGNVFTQSVSRDGAVWTSFGTTPNIAFAPKVLAGLAVSAVGDGQISTATFDNVTLGGSPVTEFGGRTIGFVNEQGSESLAGSVWTVSGSGAGITGGTDEAHFPSMEVTGDFTLAARVTSLTGGGANAQAGIMVRDDRTHYARAVHAGWVKNNTVEQRYRLQSNTTAFGSGVDYSLPADVLTIPAGQTTGNITLSIVNDTMDEPDNLVTIQLQNAKGANVGTNAYHGFTIIDDDNPPAQPYAGFATASSSVVESAGTVQIAVALSSPATATCSVDYSTTDGTATQPGDYTTTTGTLIFAAGESVKYISVPITDDSTLEPGENLTLTLASPVALNLGSASTHTLMITDDDSPAVSIVANDASASESGDAGQFTLTRTGDTAASLIVNVTRSGTATNSTDYTNIATTQTIPAGQASVVVNVTPVQDATNEGNETVILTVATGSGYVIGTPSAATVTIADDDRSTVTITANDPTASESGDAGQFTVTRTAPTNVALTANITIAGTATNTTDYTTVTTTVSFVSGDVFKTVSITPVDDGITEGPEDVTISLSSGSYDIGADSFDNVSITDNDNPPTVFIGSPTAQAPLIAAANGVIVSAQVSDDGFPNALATTWNCVSGPGVATIESPSATTTAVTFSTPGTYVLRISATDGQFTVGDQVTVVVGSGLVASNWITQDMGPSSSRRGQGLEYGGLFSVTGTGAGYNATSSDQAHIMVRSAVGDGSVVARLTSFSTTAALAGVTIRDSLARGSNRAVLGYVPGTGLQFRTRAASGNDISVAATAPALPFWLKLERNATTNEISASHSTDGTAWTAVGTPVVIPMLNTNAHYGLTTTNNSTAGTATALFDNVTLTPTPSGPALVNEDSGTAPNTAGSASFDGTTYTVNGPTTGYFYGWQYYGDMVMTVRLNTFSSGAGSSSGGIRIAESIESGAQLHLGRMPTGSYSGYYWTSIAGGSGGGVPSSIAAGNWMRIVRRGNAITGYRATHNSTTNNPNAWTQIGQPQTIIMTTPVWAGFFVNNASGATGTQNACTFTRLTIEPLHKAPVIAATAGGSISPVTLDGTITDDDLPATPTSLWTRRGGPTGIVFANATFADTTATLTESDTFVFRLTADDTGTVSFFDLNLTAYTTPFAQWLDTTSTGNENNQLVEATADADGDGLVNLLEYATGTNGTVNNTSPQIIEFAPSSGETYLRLTISKNPAATDVVFEVQATGNLADPLSWSSVGLVIEEDTPTTLRVRDVVPASAGQSRFMRVKVTQ